MGEPRAAPPPAAGATGSPSSIATASTPARPWPTSTWCRRCHRRPAVRRAARPSRRTCRRTASRCACSIPGSRIALSDILPLAENLGLRVLSEAPFLLQARATTAVALQVLSVETADKSPVDLAASRPALRRGARQGMGGRAGKRRAQPAGAGRRASPGARSRSCAPMPSICGRPASPSARTTWSACSSSYPAIARLVVDLFLARFDPALGEAASDTRKQKLEAARSRDSPRALERRGDPRRGPHPAALPQRRALHPAHQLLADRAGRSAEGLDLLQDRQPRHRRAAGAPAAGRDLRLQPAHGGHPSARRPGGARRHPLVRPARGFPHRDPGPDEDPDGEERRHRAGGLQGRLLRQAAAGSAARASRSRPKASPATRR